MAIDAVAPDGSPVAVYRRLRAGLEPGLIHAAVSPGATILELGCGTGRVTVPLAALGHRVTAVDQSAAMLAELPPSASIELIQADIETLELDRTWDAVLLGSHLLNTPDGLAAAFLATARRHLARSGLVLAEVYPPAMDWPGAVGRRSLVGEVAITVLEASVQDRRLTAVIEYEVDGRSWRQPFEADLLDEPLIRQRLESAGFAFDWWLDEPSGWLLATHGSVMRRGNVAAGPRARTLTP